MANRVILFLSLCLSLAGAALGQSFSGHVSRLTVEDGLSQGSNYFVYKDSEGFVWLSSLIGLNRFDGRQVKVYRPTDGDDSSLYGLNIQSSFFETKEQNLWFSTWEGLNCYVRKTDNFKHFVFKKEDGSPIAGYHAFYQDSDGNLWTILNYADLYFFNIPTERFIFKHKLPIKTLRATAVPNKNGAVEKVLYLGFTESPGLLMSEYDGRGKLTNSATYFAKDDPYELYIRKAIFQNDSCWMATDKGLALYVLGAEEPKFFYPSNSSSFESCVSFEKFNDRYLLVILSDRGLMAFDMRQGKFLEEESLKSFSSVEKEELVQIHIDDSHNVWVSLEQQGVEFFNPLKRKFWSVNVKPPFGGNTSIVTAFGEDLEGNLWIGTFSNGVAVLDKALKTITWKREFSDPPKKERLERVINIFPDQKGRNWILSWEGVFLGQAKDEKLRAVPELTGRFLAACVLKNGRIIMASQAGYLYEILESDKGKFIQREILNKNEPEPFTSLYESRNGYVLGCFDLEEIWVMDSEDNFNLRQRIPLRGESSSFCELPGDSSIWIANSYGLVRLTPKDGRFELTNYKKSDGLPSDVVYSIVPDTEGNLWIGTANGVSRFNLSTNTFQNFGIADGLSSLQFNAFASIQRKNGEIWLGSNKGINYFDPKEVRLIESPASPVITQILVNDQRDLNLVCAETGATNISEIKSLRLSHSQNTLSFYFASLEYSDPESTRFRYKMADVDMTWVDAETENFARYARILPGQHTFSFAASNSDGIWSEERSIEIFIKPPFVETVWFYLLLALGVAGLTWGIFITRLRQQEHARKVEEEKRQALQAERERIARDVHDDLGSGLSALSILTEIAKNKETEAELRESLGKISKSSRDLSGKIREVIWTVNSKNDSLANLISYMDHYAIELMENAEIDYQINIPNPIPEATLSGTNRRTLFLVFKEALNNIVKHSEAEAVSIDFAIANNELQILVRDDGKGFDPALLTSSPGNGLLNMQTRMKDINGNCLIKTDSNGVQIKFSLRLV